MSDTGLSDVFIAWAVELASLYEGVGDLLCLWAEEDEPEERERIIADIEAIIRDLEGTHSMPPTATQRIVSDPQIRSGAPHVRSTRLSVHVLLEMMASGATQERLREMCPHLTPEGVCAALEFAALAVRGASTGPER